MKQTAQAYEELIERFTRWASAEPNIRAASVIGSRARIDHPADEWADLDIMLVTQAPDHLISRSEWLANLGVPILTFTEFTAGGDPERRVLFEGGLDVDFALVAEEKVRGLLEVEISPQLARDLSNSLGRGMRVLLDKDGLIAQFQARLDGLGAPSFAPPPLEEFLHIVHDFWYHAVWTAKHLRRGELWWAKMGCDGRLKSLLGRMIEWQARATQGMQRDTWFGGRFLEAWADPRVVEGLREAFAHYDEADLWRALFATMDLFRWLAGETAARWSYSYPTSEDVAATALVMKLFSERKGGDKIEKANHN